MVSDKKNLFISYSNDIQNISSITSVIDKFFETDRSTSITTQTYAYEFSNNDPIIRESIIENVERADAVLLIISPKSAKSPWVLWELCMFQAKFAENPDEAYRKIVPILYHDDGTRLAGLRFLENLSVIDYTTEDSSAILQACERIRSALKDENSIEANAHLETSRYFFHVNKGERLKSQIKDSLQEVLQEPLREINNQIEKTTGALAATSSVLSPVHVSLMEKEARKQIWVVSRDFFNDLVNEDFKESIIANYDKGIEYSYFSDKPKKEVDEIRDQIYERFDLQKRIAASGKSGRKKIKKPRFYALGEQEDNQYRIIMPFDEMVLYDPNGGRGLTGYVELTFDRYPDRQTSFIDLPVSVIERQIAALASATPLTI